jgi:hypothetical protein
LEEALPSRSETGGGKGCVSVIESKSLLHPMGEMGVTGREVWGGAQLCHIGQLRWWDARLGRGATGVTGANLGVQSGSYTAPCGARAEHPKLGLMEHLKYCSLQIKPSRQILESDVRLVMRLRCHG